VTTPERQFELAASSGILFGPLRRPVFRLTGADATRYLHGRVTQEIKALTPGMGNRSLLLTPQGKIQGQFLVLREESAYLLISDPLDSAGKTEFLSALLQFKVADDVVTEDISDSLVLFHYSGPEDAALKALQLELVPGALTFKNARAFSTTAFVVRHPYGPFAGLDFLVLQTDAERFAQELTQKLSIERGDESGLELLRIAARRPRMEADLSEKILGPEIDVSEVVSFQKGCYAGQEVVEMATARGRPNRMLTLFESEGSSALEAGSEIRSGDTLCGFITSSAVLPTKRKVFALGFLKTSCAHEDIFTSAGQTLRKAS